MTPPPETVEETEHGFRMVVVRTGSLPDTVVGALVAVEIIVAIPSFLFVYNWTDIEGAMLFGLLALVFIMFTALNFSSGHLTVEVVRTEIRIGTGNTVRLTIPIDADLELKMLEDGLGFRWAGGQFLLPSRHPDLDWLCTELERRAAGAGHPSEVPKKLRELETEPRP